ncbi:MAG: DUF2141 domain-containing protein [Candidatus Andeanibacterium colombiense]|uniref:DUF2141 domain-containing protein n=1 Tax=Candidatus Andeanibacterium colombiense TaxID=3121345 RepID=A0AAJ6BLJ6_9SPHN|nr:MAG: DUF2141 domain-containing protein [Sphingomonadaceae bacterium]
MRHRSRPLAALSLAAAALGVLLGATGGGTSVSVTVTNLRNSNGVVRACLTGNAKDWPDCKIAGTSQKIVVKAATSVTFTFENVAPGSYGIAIAHDENDNGKLDRALLLMPKEGYGFSRDAPVVMGPPSFKAAAFQVAGQPVSQTIKMRYMF